MVKRAVGLLLLVLVVSLLGASAVLAASSPAAAERLYNETPISGTLTGNRGGAFAYYRIEYPGNGNVVSVELTVAPGDPAAMKGISLKLYNASGTQLGTSVPIDKGLAVPYSDNVAGTWTVQFANYLDGTTIYYSIVAKGLPTVAVATATAVPGQTPVPGTTPTTQVRPGATATPAAPLAGSLTGNSAGAFVKMPLDYAANGSDMVVTVFYTPSNPATAKGVGVTVYGPNGQMWKGEPGGANGEIKVTVNSSTAGAYELVIWNYIDGFTMNYSVTK